MATISRSETILPVGSKAKRFKCQHCQRPFARLEHLQRHERIHSGVKPFSCAKCHYSFTRSDLLVRHERLTHHKGDCDSIGQSPIEHVSKRPRKRMRGSSEIERPAPEIPGMMTARTTSSMTGDLRHPIQDQTPGDVTIANDEFSLAALSMAAEYESMHGTEPTQQSSPHSLPAYLSMHQSSELEHRVQQPDSTNELSADEVAGSNIGESLDSLAAFLDYEPLTSYQFGSLINTEQPMPFFSPESYNYGYDNDMASHGLNRSSILQNLQPRQPEDSNTFSRFGSRLPSLQPEDLSHSVENGRRSLADVSPDDRMKVLNKLDEFASVLPPEFKLPTRLALCRYIAAYNNGFHEHMPFLHTQTMSIDTCHVELLLAMAAVGAQYTFEGEKGVVLFNASRAIATHRIRRRDARLVQCHRRLEIERPDTPDLDGTSSTISTARKSSISGPLGLPTESNNLSTHPDDLMQTAQALLLLMALCTWAKHKEILREALAIQSILATVIRDDGLENAPASESISWPDWVRYETIKRTKYIVYAFSNLHCIVYNIPPFILTSEVRLTLPCSAAEFKATNESAWKQLRQKSLPEINFQDALKRLFSKDGRDVTQCSSSVSNYTLIHAIIQHIFFLRQVARGRFDGIGDLSAADVASLENALRNWQIGWKRNPESSLDPMSPNGPVAFNSTALLRLAYIRLYVDTAGRALDTRDPPLIAIAFRDGPPIRRSPKITRAVLHSAHALSIPVKIGYRLVAKTQSFIWSIQHSLCTLECAYLLSKWLEALAHSTSSDLITEDEQRITSIVRSMLDETEFAVPADILVGSPTYMKNLSAGVLRVWATIFKGAQTWAIVDVIGSALNLYADMLEASE